MQEKSQSSDFASSTGFTLKICKVFHDQIVPTCKIITLPLCQESTYQNCFHVLRFHNKNRHNYLSWDSLNRLALSTWLDGNPRLYKTLNCFFVSNAKPL